MKIENLREITNKIKELPTPDFLVQNIISISSDTESDMKELVNSISQSPTLTAKILRLANSAYYSLPKRITRLTQAVNLLGLKTVRNLALSIFTVENFFDKEYPFFNTYNFWQHLITTGIASELLAKYLNFPEKEESFMCGILHDLGKIVMAHIMPEVFEMVIKVAQHEKISFFESENLLSTIGHQQLGKILFENWNMSDIVLDVVSLHNQPLNLENETNKKILYIVHLADSTINLLFYGFSGCYNIPVVESEVWNFLGINYSMYESYFEDLKKTIERSKELIYMNQILNS